MEPTNEVILSMMETEGKNYLPQENIVSLDEIEEDIEEEAEEEEIDDFFKSDS